MSKGFKQNVYDHIVIVEDMRGQGDGKLKVNILKAYYFWGFSMNHAHHIYVDLSLGLF